MISSNTQRPTGLPRFFKEAISNFRLLNWERTAAPTTEDEARATPIWTTNIIQVTNRNRMRTWTYDLHLNRVMDIFEKGGKVEATIEEVRTYIIGALPNTGT